MKFATNSTQPPTTRDIGFPPPTSESGHRRALRRATTCNNATNSTLTLNGMTSLNSLLFTPSNSSPHFVCVQQQNGSNHHLQPNNTPINDVPPITNGTTTHHTNNNLKSKEKPPQRRNSFFGSLFGGNNRNSSSSSNIFIQQQQQQQNDYASAAPPANNNNHNNYTNGTTRGGLDGRQSNNAQNTSSSPSNQSTSSRSSGIWMMQQQNNASSGRESANSARDSSGRDSATSNGGGNSRRPRSVSTASSTNKTTLDLRNIVEHRPASAREAALETFAVISKKRICVVRKFGSHMDTTITLLLDNLGREADTQAFYLTVDQQTGSEILSAVQRNGLPLVFINGDCIGGISDFRRLYQNGFLAEALKPHDYDLIVLGGGSGGIAAAMEAASLGKRVACVDYLHTDGSVSATCMNVGRVPKKLMQQAALVGAVLKNAEKFGWSLGGEDQQKPAFDWSTIRKNIQEHVDEMNAKHEKELTAHKVDYIKAYGVFSGSHSLTLRMMADNSERQISADRIMVAVGLRSKLPNLQNAQECCIGSDDLFSLSHNPGQTLCIGDSFISLEIAGFLNALGNEVTVLLRSRRIRGFDEDIADRIQKHLTSCGVRFITGVVSGFQRVEEASETEPGVVIATIDQSLADGTTEELKSEFNTVVCASAREPRTANLNFQKPNIKLSATGKILGRHEQSQTAPHIYAVGDVLEGAVEFSQVSSGAAALLMRRLYTGAMVQTDYERVMTSVLTPLEYCSCGFTESEALQHYGSECVAIYEAPIRDQDACTQAANCSDYAMCKALFLKPERERLIGFQILAPHASDIAAGFSMAMKLQAHRSDFHNLVGVNPSAAEAFGALQPKMEGLRKASY